MPTKRASPKHLSDVEPDVLAIFSQLSMTQSRDDLPIFSNPGTKYQCYNFRQRIYLWRRAMLDALGTGPDAEPNKRAQRMLLEVFGPRVDHLFLSLTQFSCQPIGGNQWWVAITMREPMAGPDITWPQTKLDRARHVLDELNLADLLARAKRAAGRAPDLS